MSLPSKYAPGGLSSSDQHRIMTSGSKRSKKPVNYTIRTIEDRVNDAFENRTYTLDSYKDGDIEMVPMDDHKEVDAISDFVNYTRNDVTTVYSTPMMPVVEDLMVEEGNISYLVLDTNFILSHLNIVDGLKNIASEYGLRIIIPTMVMMELDGLKKSTRTSTDSDERLSGKSVGRLARWANDWIYSVLADTSKVVSGQKINQKIDKHATQDEAILDCGLYFQMAHPNAMVVLLSNDKNLCIKSLANDLLTVSYRKDMTPKYIAQMIHDENIQRNRKIEVKNGHIEGYQKIGEPHQIVGNYPQMVENYPQMDENDHQIDNIEMDGNDQIEVETPVWSTPMNFQQCASTIFREVQILTLSVVHHCMETVYGEDLDMLRNYDHNSITTLGDCVDVFIRFWSTVFRDYFRKLPSKFVPFDNDGAGIRSLKKQIYIHEPLSQDELKSFVQHWSTALEILYLAEMDPGQNAALEKLIMRWNGLAGK